MSIIPITVLPESSAPDAKPVNAGAPVSHNGTSDKTTQTSFPAVLAQANQQGPTPKAVPSGKVQSETPTSSPLLAQGNIEGEATSGLADPEGIQASLLTTQPGGLEAVPVPTENFLALALTSNVPGEPTTEISSQIGVSAESSKLPTGKTENTGTPVNSALLPATSAVNVVLQGEVESGVVQPVPILNKHVDGQNPQIAPLSTVAGQQDVPTPTAIREPVGAVQFASRPPLPNVPLSFVNGGFSQGPVVGEPVNLSTISTAIPQHIQGSPSLAPGTINTTGNESSGNGQVPVLGKGEGETGGSSPGFEQRGHQENGAAFSHKQQASSHLLGRASFGEPGNEFRVTESQSVVRPETVAERSRMMNLLSPQRLQMDVMLADEAKVKVDVLVKHQQVSAQLVTDQLMLRNLALQHEPHLDAQLSSVGLELKQFGAEVGEQGLFGQHLSDSPDQDSSNDSNGNGIDDASVPQESDVLAGAGVGADGRLHYVA